MFKFVEKSICVIFSSSLCILSIHNLCKCPFKITLTFHGNVISLQDWAAQRRHDGSDCVKALSY